MSEGTNTFDNLAQADLPSDNDWQTVALAVINGRIEAVLNGNVVASANSATSDSGNIGIENMQGMLWYNNLVVCSASIGWP